MRNLLFILGTVAGFAFLGTGCRSLPQARVVRATLTPDSVHWKYSVNGKGEGAVLSDSEFTNQLSRLRLQHGDLILFGTAPSRKPGPALKTWDWLADYCESNRVAMYEYTAVPPSEDIFSLVAYHWVAPFDNPRDFDGASYFHEGEFLGTGMSGYQKLVSEIERSRPPQMFILGSLRDMTGSFGPFEAPYETQEYLLKTALSKSGTKLLLLDPLPGF